jgi:hypothetical protein
MEGGSGSVVVVLDVDFIDHGEVLSRGLIIMMECNLK